MRPAWSISLAVLLATSACSSHDAVPRRLGERLESISGEGTTDLSRDEVQQALERQLRNAPLPREGGTNPGNPVFPTRATLQEFYAANGSRLAWCNDSGNMLPASTLLLDALRRAGEHGLDPEDYALSRLQLLGARIGKTPLDDAATARLADFDLLMTAAFFRYASDLSSGRVHPDEVRDDWHTNPPGLDPLTRLDQALQGDHLSQLLEALPPPHEGYARLREALRGLREVQFAGGWPAIPDGPTLKAGTYGPRVVLLRQRLQAPVAEADPQMDTATGPDGRFNEALAQSVRRFQERHGLELDGMVGPHTLAELNVPVEARIRQVELNLERWRWIPRVLGDPHVLVNIPEFGLEMVRGGVTEWRTRIVVGRAYTPTPVFSDRIVAVVVNPPWNVPESIALAEYVPELREDAEGLERRGFRLIEGTGENARVVDPKALNLQALGKEHFPYRLRQDPGPDNALGRLKFHLMNDYQIYLHDTPTPGLFRRLGRDLSHGCIRVEGPLELAVQLLGEPAEDHLRDLLDKTEERHLSVKPAVPIHMLYLTAWVDEAGGLRYCPDIYKFDGPQRTALERTASRVLGGPASGARQATGPAGP